MSRVQSDSKVITVSRSRHATCSARIGTNRSAESESHPGDNRSAQPSAVRRIAGEVFEVSTRFGSA